MAQIRYVDYLKPLTSYDQNKFLAMHVPPGLIAGWDSLAIISGNSIEISHPKGISISTETNDALDGPYGAVKSVNGTLVLEDEAIALNLDFNPSNSMNRTDILVMTHEWLASGGGATASYSIIKGAIEDEAIPTVSNANTQVIIGRFIIAPNATDHAETIWVKADEPFSSGNKAFVARDDQELNRWPTEAHYNDFSRLLVNGVFYIANSPNVILNPPISGTGFSVMVFRTNQVISQLAMAVVTGKVYARSSVDSGAAWTGWRNLNNADVDGDVAALLTAVGDVNTVYSSNNYINNGDDLVVAAGKMDAAIAANESASDNNASDITGKVSKTGDSMSGNLAMANNKVTGLAAATAAGQAARYEQVIREDGSNAFTGNQSMGNNKLTGLGVGLLAGDALRRDQVYSIDTPTGTTITKVIEIGVWDMNTNNTVIVAHGISPTAMLRIRHVSAMIQPDNLSSLLPLNSMNTISYNIRGGVSQVTDTNITLARRSSESFDSTFYNDAVMNRGWIFIKYLI